VGLFALWLLVPWPGLPLEGAFGQVGADGPVAGVAVAEVAVAEVAVAEVAVTLTLERAIALALEHNLGLAAAAAGAEVNAAEQTVAQRLWWPSVRLEAGYQRSDSPVLVFGGKLAQESFGAADFGLDALNRPDFFDDWSTRIVAEQPLWTGGRIGAANDAASAAAEAAQSSLERARQEIVRGVVERFTGVQLAEQAVVTAESALASATANVGLVQDRFDAGLVVISDLLLAQVRRSELEELLAHAEADLEVARASLNLVLGQAQATALELEPRTEEADADSARVASLEELVVRALERRPDLAAIRRHARAASAGADLARAARRPELGLSAILEAHDRDFLGVDGDNATVGVGLRWSLFEGGRLKARATAAEAATREAEHRAALLAQQVELEVRSEVARLRSASARVRLAREGVALARASLVVVEDRYRNGLITLVELLQAEASLTAALLREIASQRDAVLARAALDLATGDLGNG
jgi:outer membrane protein TolC